MRLLRLALLVSRLPQRFVYKIGNYVTSVTLEKAHASCYATYSGGRAWLSTSHPTKDSARSPNAFSHRMCFLFFGKIGR
jgi:hypothetical protein